MPFTPSHVAAVLPFARTPLLPAGLAIGAMMPDLFYYVPIDIPRSFAHSWLGVVTVDLAFGVALFFAWQFVFRAPVFDFFPEWVRVRIKPRERMPRGAAKLAAFAALLIASVLLGCTTHVLWDSFTHAHSLFGENTALAAMLGPLPIYKWLQHASTVIGALALVGFVLWWRSRTQPGTAAPTRLTRRTRVGGWLIVGAAGLAVSLVVWFRGVGRGASPFAPDLLFDVVTIGLAAAALSAVLLCVIWLFRSRVALAGVLVVLVGCAPVAELWPDTDEEQAELGLMPPAQVFHGDCERAFAVGDLSAALGSTMAIVDTTASPSLLPVLSGGTTCLWNSADGVTVSALFLPTDAVSYTPVDGCGEISYYNTPGCFIESTANGIRLSGFVHRAGLSDTEALAADAAKLVALFTLNAVEAEAAPVPSPVVGAWQTPADCEAVLGGVDFADAFRVTAEFALGQSAGSGVPYSPAEVALWNEGEPPICGINKTSDDFHRFDFEVFGGARWMAEKVAVRPGAVKVDVEGLELVFKTDVGTEYSTVDVFDGVNYLRLSGLNMEANYPAIRAMIAYFNGE